MGSKKKGSNVSLKFFRKVGHNKPFISSNLCSGDVFVIAAERGILKKEIMESFRRVVTRELNRLGKINIPLTFNIPVSGKSMNSRMGKGKGKVLKHIARISSGTVLLEIKTCETQIAIQALSKALHKLPIKAGVRSRIFFFND
jgi:large subunit ribosomal protein L16